MVITFRCDKYKRPIPQGAVSIDGTSVGRFPQNIVHLCIDGTNAIPCNCRRSHL